MNVAIACPTPYAAAIDIFAPQATASETALLLNLYCDTCGSAPCILPSFCAACRAADLRRGYRVPTLEIDFKHLAQRAFELAQKWRSGLLGKIEAVDRSYDFAIALGLHYRLARSAEDFQRCMPEMVIQRVLAAAFARPR